MHEADGQKKGGLVLHHPEDEQHARRGPRLHHQGRQGPEPKGEKKRREANKEMVGALESRRGQTLVGQSQHTGRLPALPASRFRSFTTANEGCDTADCLNRYDGWREARNTQ